MHVVRTPSTSSGFEMVEAHLDDPAEEPVQVNQQLGIDADADDASIEEEVEELEEEIVEDEELVEEEVEEDEEPAVGCSSSPAPSTPPSAPAEPAPTQASAQASQAPDQPEELPQPAGDESFAALRALEAQVIDKLSGFSFKSLGETLQAGTATSSLSKWATGWFGDTAASSTKPRSLQLTTTTASQELQELFNLHETEQLVESFKCKLLQTYSCSHNSFTPSIQMAFQGALHITDQHVCFGVEERGKQLHIKVALSLVTSVARQQPTQRGATSDVLKLDLKGDKQHVAFKDFEHGSGALDSALALIEHLTAQDT